MADTCCSDTAARISHLEYLVKWQEKLSLFSDYLTLLFREAEEAHTSQITSTELEARVKRAHDLCIAFVDDYTELQRLDTLIRQHQRHALKVLELAYDAKLDELLAVDTSSRDSHKFKRAGDAWYQVNMRVARIHTGLLKLRLYSQQANLQSDQDVYSACESVDFRNHKRLISSDSKPALPRLVMFRLPTALECREHLCEISKLCLVLVYEGVEQPYGMNTQSTETSAADQSKTSTLLHYTTLNADDHEARRTILKLAHAAGGPVEHRWFTSMPIDDEDEASSSVDRSGPTSLPEVAETTETAVSDPFSDASDYCVPSHAVVDEGSECKIQALATKGLTRPRFTIFASAPVGALMTHTPCTCRAEWERNIGSDSTPPKYIIVSVGHVAALPKNTIHNAAKMSHDTPHLHEPSAPLEWRLQVYGEVEWYSSPGELKLSPFR